MFRLTVILPLLIVAIACDDASTTSAKAAPSRPASSAQSAAAPVVGTAIIRGVVRFQGAAPKLASTDGARCHAGAAAIPDETVVLNSSGGIKNVFVYIKDAAVSDPPSDALLLDQVDCRYIPHAIALHTGQPLRIKSSEDTLHNVHIQCSENPAENFALTSAGAEKTVSFKVPEFFKIACDVHPWMSAYVGVFDHPFFAVTDDQGAFTIPKVPAGTYTLATWHERFGQQEWQITITDNQTLTSDFVYKAP